MNFKSCYRNPMNRLALGFFIAALVCFGVFHFVSIDGNPGAKGWAVWSELFHFIKRGAWRYMNPKFAFGFGSFLGMAILTLSGPFLFPVVGGSRLVRWVLTFFSFAILAGFGVFMVMRSPVPGLWWLLVSQILNFIGFLCLRSLKPEKTAPTFPPAE